MPNFSAISPHAFLAGLYEAQDVLAGCDDVDIIRVETSRMFPLGKKMLWRLAYLDVSQKLVSINPGLRSVRLTKDYELFMLVCPFLRDVWYANAIEGWRDHCRTSVCWIHELWISQIPHLQYLFPLLERFDHVIIGMDGSGKALSDAVGRRCYETPFGVDAIRFSPYPEPPSRVIDVYSVGRRWEGIHQRLRESAGKCFYIYDTLVNQSDGVTHDHSQHRDLYANIAKRSRFFMVAPGKMNCPEETQGQAAFGTRYFEGTAAGAVLLGQAPDSDSFRRYFDWPDAVIDIQPDGSDTVETISRLSADPERLREISCRNVEESLRRHDWVYRWKEILGIAGLKPMPGMQAREKRLGELAALVRDKGR